MSEIGLCLLVRLVAEFVSDRKCSLDCIKQGQARLLL